MGLFGETNYEKRQRLERQVMFNLLINLTKQSPELIDFYKKRMASLDRARSNNGLMSKEAIEIEHDLIRDILKQIIN